jgi:hypothetical protein
MATNTYVALKSTTLGSDTKTVSITSIPQGYTDLVLIANCRSSRADYDDAMYLQVGNGSIDTGSNYSKTFMSGANGSAGSGRNSNLTYIDSRLSAASATNTPFSPNIFQFQNYSNITTYKTTLFRWNEPPSGGTDYGIAAAVGLWRSTAAIDTITFTCAVANFTAGSTFTLYGVAAQPQSTAKATGGNIAYGADGYIYHTFTSSGTFTPLQSLTVDYLVVAGGGSGGGEPNNRYSGGGGGAGGLRCTVDATGGGGSLESQLTLSSGTGYTVTIGAGGTGTKSRGSSGNNSVFASITSVGGGAGGSADDGNAPSGLSGGSGGGTGGYSGTYGAGTAGQGYSGGTLGYSGSGGGGAGGVGGNALSVSGTQVGGIGIQTSINGTATYYAGGGGGAPNSSSAAGGLGGGGAGQAVGNGTAGTPNTGGGGGGATQDYVGGVYGGNGGSGIVIVRYAN